jgi:hypothetical protein
MRALEDLNVSGCKGQLEISGFLHSSGVRRWMPQKSIPVNPPHA